MRHAVAWLVWVICTAALALTIRNPLFLLIIVLAVWVVWATVSGRETAQNWRGLLRIGAMIWLITVPFNALMIHRGQHVLFRLPSTWPLIGGIITLEAIFAGLVSGLALWTVLFAFATFHQAVDASQLLTLVPPFLYQAGVVTSIALTFIPQMVSSAQEIREAQRVRGHRFRRWRDLIPLVMPLLTTGFERAIQLAESMESRGFGAQRTIASEHKQRKLRWATLLSLGLMLGGMLARLFWDSSVGNLLIADSGVLFVVVFWERGRLVRRSRYRRQGWRRGDNVMVLGSVGALGLCGLLRAQDPALFAYSPYASAQLVPNFNGWVGLALALLALPAFVWLFGMENTMTAGSVAS